jgi:hypothetical protein
MATLAPSRWKVWWTAVKRETQWRFRLLPIHFNLRATSFSLSTDGSKAIVTTNDGNVHFVDLAQKVLEIPQQPTTTPIRYQRYLQEWRAFAGPGDVLMVKKDTDKDRKDRKGRVEGPSGCRQGISAVAQTDRSEVWLLGDGALCHGTVSEDGDLLLIPQRVSESHLLLVHRGTDVRVISASSEQFISIDPVTGTRTPLPGVGTVSEALLLSAGGFVDDGSIDRTRPVVARLARELDAQATRYLQDRSGRPMQATWSVWTPIPNVALYAPSLEFAENEPVRPTSIEVWNVLKEEFAKQPIQDPKILSKSPRRAENARTAAAMGAYERRVFKTARCSIYTVTRSYPGSWLHEYWLYYPFDVGQGAHLHDTEHVFIEVDKLGGAVHQVIGAAHGPWASNNIYKAASPNVLPITLPIYTIAEFGKHASAPDINRDLKFTVGVDVNTFRDKAKIWGIRDTTAHTDANLRGYDGTMVLDRRFEDVWHPVSFDAYFPSARHQATGSQTCDLLPFPSFSRQACNKQDGRSLECAAAEMNGAGDYRDPQNALKRSYAPVHTLRYSFAGRPQVGADGQIGPTQWLHSLGGVADISWFQFLPDAVRPPGRLSLDFYAQWNFSSGFEGVQARYERLLSNLAGLYVGGSLMKRAPEQQSGTSPERDLWLDVGAIVFEWAPHPLINIGGQVGLSYTNGAGIGFEYRFVGAWLRKGEFGIGKKTATPY